MWNTSGIQLCQSAAKMTQFDAIMEQNVRESRQDVPDDGPRSNLFAELINVPKKRVPFHL
jgi:hypothetical protein